MKTQNDNPLSLEWGAVHMIPEWLSFQNEFTPSPYISLYLVTWSRDEVRSRTSLSGMSSFRFSIRMKFSFWYDISFWYHVNWKRTPFRDENANRVVWGEWSMRIVFKLVDKTVVFKMAESVNFVMWMQYELRSGTKLIPEWNSFWYHVNSPWVIVMGSCSSSFKRTANSLRRFDKSWQLNDRILKHCKNQGRRRKTRKNYAYSLKPEKKLIITIELWPSISNSHDQPEHFGTIQNNLLRCEKALSAS